MSSRIRFRASLVLVALVALSNNGVAADPPTIVDDQGGIDDGGSPRACFSDYCSTYGSSRTHNIEHAPGVYSFEVDATACNRGTEWYINGVYQGAEHNDCSGSLFCTDPSVSIQFPSEGSSTIQAIVYYAPDCPGGSWSYQETHTWNVQTATPRPDLIAYSVSVSDSTVNPGQSVTVSWTAKNQGTGSAGSTQQGVMWSTDSTITRSDTLLDEEYLGPINAGSTSNESHSITIPSNATPGSTYYIGVYADYDLDETELSENNNGSSSVPLTVNGPDLIAYSVSVSDSTVNPGQSVTVSWTAKNQGTGSAGSTQQGVMWSTNSTITRSDTLLDEEYLGPINAGSTSNESHSITIPSNATPGSTYYIGVYADYDLDETELNENNNGSSSVPLTVNGPDLIAYSVSVSDSTVNPGQSVTVSWTAKNQGTGSAGSTQQGVMWSTDSTITRSDTLLDEEYLGPINAGSTSNESHSITIPSNATPGSTYYIGVYADYDLDETELNENNNGSTAVGVTINQADLIVESIGFSPSLPLEGQTVTVSYRVKNQGSVNAPQFRIGYIVDGTLIATVRHPGLATGGIIEDGITGVFSAADDYDITVCADWLNEIPESDENNNCRTKLLTVDRNCLLDDDSDGIGNCDDRCPGTPQGEQADQNGCSCTQLDDDNDGINNCYDQCPNTPQGEPADQNGCSCTQLDDDNDGVNNCHDQCPDTPQGEQADQNGCSCSVLDDDLDGVNNCNDQCPDTPAAEPVDPQGCACNAFDDDNDGVDNCSDACPATPPGEQADQDGCSCSQLDEDFDGVNNCNDQCPGTPQGEQADEAGCSCSQLDNDFDGVNNCYDQCPSTPQGEQVNQDGCSCSQLDDDFDGVNNCNDQCPNTPQGEQADQDGCSCSQLDDDSDGVNNCNDQCLNTPQGEPVDYSGCPCGQLDDDNDGVSNCDDQCANTPLGEQADQDGCACSQLDDDKDGVNDCDDQCPGTPQGEQVDHAGCSCSQLDDDNDGVNNCDDACRGFDDNSDADTDGVPDGCDICAGFNDAADTDGDGVPDGCDPCPADVSNDTDDDGVCDSADVCPGFDDAADADGDNVPNGCDNCPNDPNPLQEDANDNGIGDVCEVIPPPFPFPCGVCGYTNMSVLSMLFVGMGIMKRRIRRKAQ